MPKKINEHKQYSKNAREFMRRKRDEAGGAKPFFELIYKRVPIENESITLNNLINRGNYSAEFVGLVVESLNLKSVTLGEFYLNNN